jgi:oxygen-independent coproporphyrinogen-3 oxidase
MVKKLRSVYIGGGTPVTLRRDLLERVLKAIGYSGVEFTVEAGRPDCITEDSLKLLKDYGVTRICVNPQTFNDKTLALIGRRHTANDVVEKFALAKKYGFDVNMDLIAGLPDETFDDFAYSIDKAISLKPENITVHTLCLKKGADLKNDNERLSGEGVTQMVEYSHKQLHSAEYLPYYLYRQKYMAGNLENTGYALKGKACTYNIDVMEEIADNIACGANAVSKVVFGGENRIERYANPKDVKTYIDKIETIKAEKNKLFAPKNLKNK